MFDIAVPPTPFTDLATFASATPYEDAAPVALPVDTLLAVEPLIVVAEPLTVVIDPNTVAVVSTLQFGAVTDKMPGAVTLDALPKPTVKLLALDTDVPPLPAEAEVAEILVVETVDGSVANAEPESARTARAKRDFFMRVPSSFT